MFYFWIFCSQAKPPRKRRTTPLPPPSPPLQPEPQPGPSSEVDYASESEIEVVTLEDAEAELEETQAEGEETEIGQSSWMDLESVDTPRKVKLKRALKKQQKRLFTQKKKIKTLLQRNRRFQKRNASLKNVIKDLKDKFHVNEENCSILTGISETSQFLVRRQMQKAQGKRLQKKYNEKLRSFALSLHYISPRAYEYVRKEFDTCLPHTKTLSAWYKTIDVQPGFCTEALNAIRLYCKANDGPVVTSLIIDGMAIKQDVKWDGQRHVGYVNYGAHLDDDTVPYAREALVFLLNCVNGSWKFPVAFFFVAGTTGEQLANLVKHCLTLLSETGVIVSSLTFDGAAANLSMATNLGCSLDPESLKCNFPHPVTGDKVFIFLDPCHMLKLVRNTIGERSISSNQGPIKWDYINALYSLQESEGLRLANKLTKGHIQWSDQKMKVRFAAQTLSESVAIAIDFCREKEMSNFEGSEATSSFLKKFNNLFDILNSRSLRSFGTKKALNASNFENTKVFLLDMIEYIKDLKFGEVSVLKSKRKVGFLGFIVCILSTIEMYEELVLDKKVLKFLPTYKISQDHLELLFCKIRSKGGWNNNPTAFQFISALKKIIVATELKDPRTGNCVPLEDISILHASSASAPSSNPLMNINLTTERQRSFEDDCQPDPLFEHDYVSLPEDLMISEISSEIVYYIGGFVIKHLKEKLRCEDCITSLIEKDPGASNLVHIKSKGGLIHPSRDVVHVCTLAEKHMRAHFVSKGPNGRMVSNGLVTKLDVQKAAREIITKCIGMDIFNNVQHTVQDFDQDHLVNLIKCICIKYFDVRLHHAAKRTSDLMHAQRSRQKLTKTILFRGL